MGAGKFQAVLGGEHIKIALRHAHNQRLPCRAEFCFRLVGVRLCLIELGDVVAAIQRLAQRERISRGGIVAGCGGDVVVKIGFRAAGAELYIGQVLRLCLAFPVRGDIIGSLLGTQNGITLKGHFVNVDQVFGNDR